MCDQHSWSSGCFGGEQEENNKYRCLDSAYSFTPIAIESLGACGPLTLRFFGDLGNHLKLATREENSFRYLLQRLSVAVQRGSAALVLGTTTHSSICCM